MAGVVLLNSMDLLKISRLTGGVDEKQILNGVDLVVRAGESHAIMGPNGSGKSSLAFILAGHPLYSIKSGKILLDGKELGDKSPEERARLGLFLAFQYPVEVPGVSLFHLLRSSYNSIHGPISFSEFNERLKSETKKLKLDPSFLKRGVNEGFSGGEKKKVEILQLSILKPKLAILDETDSGLDIDSLKIVAEGINRIKKENPEMAIVTVTHYFRILKYLKPDKVHVLISGKIVKSGDSSLATELEERGYSWLKNG